MVDASEDGQYVQPLGDGDDVYAGIVEGISRIQQPMAEGMALLDRKSVV